MFDLMLSREEKEMTEKENKLDARWWLLSL